MATTLIETRRDRLERRDVRQGMTYVITFTLTSAALWWIGRDRPFEDVVAAGVGAAFGAWMMASMKRSWRERRRRRGLSGR